MRFDPMFAKVRELNCVQRGSRAPLMSDLEYDRRKKKAVKTEEKFPSPAVESASDCELAVSRLCERHEFALWTAGLRTMNWL